MTDPRASRDRGAGTARGDAPDAPVVTLYGRPGCHLCADARAVVLRAAERVGGEVSLVEIDIETDDALLRAMLERIPVICVDGTEHSELFVDEDALVAALSSAHQ